nr:MAG TPA: hypothetical protein [Caudoviricetes sp.]
MGKSFSLKSSSNDPSPAPFKFIGSTEPFFIFAPTTLCINKIVTMSLLNNSTNTSKSFYLRGLRFTYAFYCRISYED